MTRPSHAVYTVRLIYLCPTLHMLSSTSCAFLLFIYDAGQSWCNWIDGHKSDSRQGKVQKTVEYIFGPNPTSQCWCNCNKVLRWGNNCSLNLEEASMTPPRPKMLCIPHFHSCTDAGSENPTLENFWRLAWGLVDLQYRLYYSKWIVIHQSASYKKIHPSFGYHKIIYFVNGVLMDKLWKGVKCQWLADKLYLKSTCQWLLTVLEKKWVMCLWVLFLA